MHIPELEKYPELFKVVAVCDPLKERRDLVSAKYPECRTYRRYEDFLADPALELIDIATRSEDHVEHTVMALKAKRWVFLEKPISLDAEGAMVLRAAAIKAGNKLFIRHNRRFEPAFVHIQEIISSGILGNVHHIRLNRGGFSRRDDWQTVKRCGGGQLLNWGPHLIDQALQFMDSRPVRIWSDLKRVASMGDAEDYVRIIMNNQQGMTVDLEISGGRVIHAHDYIVSGSKGELVSSGNKIKLKYLDPAHKLPRRRASVRTPPLGSFGSPDDLKWIEEEIDVAPKAPAGMTLVWELLAGAIRLNRPYPITMEQAVDVMKIVSLARKDTNFA
jgi:predicted dehydrogenase